MADIKAMKTEKATSEVLSDKFVNYRDNQRVQGHNFSASFESTTA